MNKVVYVFFFAGIVAFSSCVKKDHGDKPVIELLSPAPCDTLYFGDAFSFKVRVSDKDGLGNIKMDIHHNFGHHQHGDHAPCVLDTPKTAINPYFDDWIFSLPEKENDHIFETSITFPDIDFDTGDYHFHIYVTDNVGYQSFTTLSVKVFKK
jgi:hypothetical protein